MKVAVTGARGFIGKNLLARLDATQGVEAAAVAHDDPCVLQAGIADAQVVVHLAGVNRPEEPGEFATGNTGFTQALVAALQDDPKPVIYASSIKALDDSDYGRSKLAAEEALSAYSQATSAPVMILRLANVFGKWARPDYNSAVATFCHRISHDLPINVHDAQAVVRLVYIDDVIDTIVRLLSEPPAGTTLLSVEPEYAISVGDLARTLEGFRAGEQSNAAPNSGDGLARALYATYVSYLPKDRFTYELTEFKDPRGKFAEFLITERSGQVSVFTAGPGVTRGGHYHHTKVEKFLVVRGHAIFRQRNLVTGELHETALDADRLTVVQSIPGWIHEITNTGAEQLVCCLWSSETFDPARADTYARPVGG